MAGVINQGSDTLKEYQSAAAKTDKSTSPKAAFGGTLSSKSNTGSASTTTTTTSESSGTGTSTASGSAAASASSVPGAAPQLAGPIVCVSIFALIFGAMLAF